MCSNLYYYITCMNGFKNMLLYPLTCPGSNLTAAKRAISFSSNVPNRFFWEGVPARISKQCNDTCVEQQQ